MEHSLGFLGFGEAASQIACGFHTQGITENAAYDVAMNTKGGQKKLLGERLQETDVTPVESIEQLMRRSRIIFLVVPAKFARDAAMEALSYMTKEHIFCDLTTNKPSVKEELGRSFAERGYLYVDASVMGAVPIYQHRTPMYFCGNGAKEMIRLMTPLGMNLTYVGEEAGRAVKMKLTRSIFVKGVEALTLETLMTARKLGIEKEIVEGIEASFQKLGFTRFCGQLVTSGVLHAERRSYEALECRELEDELGLNSLMAEAAFQKLKWYAEYSYTKMDPLPLCSSLDELYTLWERTGVL